MLDGNLLAHFEGMPITWQDNVMRDGLDDSREGLDGPCWALSKDDICSVDRFCALLHICHVTYKWELGLHHVHLDFKSPYPFRQRRSAPLVTKTSDSSIVEKIFLGIVADA